ncbi:MAG: hypothetical protein GTN60_21080 [Pseudomonas stutzeri]|nr:hypothetical protein [Stutzerimonas stutzeri]NIM56317.1 hypothetical protein [Stutzerimonas stutzeri]NIM89247.1 hypothetical protein [Stutzerimonas stutzeri]NIN83033.1 hypothetical protein [Stutzerimonas stutzeri]NIP03169.1 hypothetical protein [Stutzerimonas stutzeri]
MKTNVVKLNTFTFDQQELDRRTNRAVENFKTTLHALDVIQLPFSVAIDAIVEAALSGKKLSKYRKPQLHGSIVFCYFEKENIEHLLEEVAEQEKEKYLAELDAEKDRNVQLLAEQLYQQEKAKKIKAEQEREQKLKDAAMKDALEYFATLEAKQ